MTVIWFLCVILGSFLPSWKILFHTLGRLHLPLHFAVFAFSGFLAFGFAPSRMRRILCCMALICLAFVVEGLQRAIYPISFEWRDVATDILGVLIALLFLPPLCSKRYSDLRRAR